MIRNVLKTLGSRLAFVAGAGIPILMAASAYAQAADAPNAPVQAGTEATAERVIVTGSYIPTAETESALPVTTYTAEVIEKQGAQTPAEGLRQLPSFVGNTVTENDSNGGDGTAAVVLRALGPQNTLTLINGRRAFLNVGGVNFTNINAIPVGAVNRVEVLKDGASAVYGSDAVAGVVNFVLINGPGEAPYQGAEIFTLYGNTTDSDAAVLQAYVRGGVTGLDGKVSIAAVGEYYKRHNLYSRDREIAGSADNRKYGGPNSGSPTYPGRASIRLNPDPIGITPEGNPQYEPARASILNDFNNATPTSTADYRKFDPTGAGTDPTRFNFRAFTPAIPAQEKANYYVTGRYKIFGDAMELYGNILYSKTKQDNGLAPAPFALGNFEVNQTPFNPFANPIPDQASDPTPGDGPPNADGSPSNFNETLQDNQLQSSAYRLVQELGNRRSFFDYDYYRYEAGISGNFNVPDNGFISRWGYDTGFLYNRNDLLEIDSGDAKRSVIVSAIAGQNVDGSPLILNGVQTFFNPLIGLTAPPVGDAPTYSNGVPTGTAHYDNTAITQQLASFIAHSYFYERDWLADAKVNAHLFPGLWNGGIDIAGGYEHRNIAVHQLPDPTQVQNDQLGFTAAPNTKYLTEVNSFFGEITIPFVTSTMNVPFVRGFDVSVAYRFEDFDLKDQFGPGTASYDNGGTPRISIRYQPIADLVLRASWGESFFGPRADQLFDPVTQNFPQLFDALVSGTLQPPDGTYQGGNAALKPEETDSYGVGAVWTPKFLPGFTATVDFYQEFTRGVLLTGAEFAQLMLSANANSGGVAFVDPDGPGGGVFNVNGTVGGPGIGITRNDAGEVRAIDSLTQNAGKRLVNGMDITLNYSIPTANWGRISFALGYNYFFTWKAEPFEGAGSTNFLGDYNNGTLPLAPGALPYHKGFLRGEWEWHNFDFVATGNYISSFNDDSAFLLASNVIGGTDTFPQYDIYRRVSDYMTLDMQLSYEFKKPPAQEAAAGYSKDAKDVKDAKSTAAVAGDNNGTFAQRMLWNTKLTVGVNNAFDRNPPTVVGALNDNYDTSLYSIRNRFWYVSINKKF